MANNKIRYKLTLEDILFSQRYVIEHSEEIKKNIRMRIIQGILLIIIVVLAISFSSGFWQINFTIALLGCMFLIFFGKKIIIGKNIKKIRKIYEQKEKLEDLKETHELEVVKNTMYVKSKLITAKVKLDAVKKTIRLKDFLLIYLNTDMPIVIPEKNITLGNLNKFIEQLPKRLR